MLRMAAMVFLSALLFIGPARGAPAAGTEFPFQFREGLIWINVHRGSSEKPLQFILDSGAEVSVINLRAARLLGLILGSPVTVRGVRSSATGYWPEHLNARLGEVRLPTDYLAVDLDELSEACHDEVDGLLGADFFRAHVVQIDFLARKIRLLDSSASSGKGETLPLKVSKGGLRVPVEINGGKPQWLRLDTGCASALQWVTDEAPPPSGPRQIAVGLSAISIPQAQTSVRLGAVEFRNVRTGLQAKKLFPGEAGLLGAGLLSRFSTITINTATRRLVLQTNSPGL